MSTDYIDACVKADRRLDPADYPLVDKAGEKRLDVNLSQALARARLNKGTLLRGHTVYCTELIRGGYDTYKAICEANGGFCALYRGRTMNHVGPKKRLSEGSDDEETEDEDDRLSTDVYLMTSNSTEEAKLWPKFRQMIQNSGKNPVIIRNDWILDLALSQEIRWKDSYEVTEADVVDVSGR